MNTELICLILLGGSYVAYRKHQKDQMVNFLIELLPQSYPLETVVQRFNQKFKLNLTIQDQALVKPTGWSPRAGRSLRAYYLLQQFVSVFQSLIASQKSVEQSAKLSALGEMAAGIAHEINNPIAIIQGIAYLVIQNLKSPNPDLPNLIQKTQLIVETTIRMDKIVNGLRYFVQDDTKNPKELATLQEILDNVQVLSIDKCQKLGVTVEINLPDPQLTLYCKPMQISQVLINLVNNAADAIKELPNPWIKLSVTTNPQFINFIVQDCGPGIPLAIQDKILQPFFTNKVTTKSSGMGLGLSIAKRITDQHQGLISIDNDSPYTTFIVSIPQRLETT